MAIPLFSQEFVMCIAQSAGNGGTNNPADVRMVQALLNENLGQLAPFPVLQIDGDMGPGTIAMITEFQRRVMNAAAPDGRIDPDGDTLLALRAGMSPGLTLNKLQGIMPTANSVLVGRYFQPLTTMMPNSQINTPMRVAHFLAQVGHESGDLRFCQEIASGEAYEGRIDLGNTEPGDGPRFKGRGLIQLTGRSNYIAFGNARGRDFVTPDNYLQLATDPNLAVDVSCWFWTTHGLNAQADVDHLNEITQRINGGLNGLADRASHLQRAKCLLVS
jgi:putative chitinase